MKKLILGITICSLIFLSIVFFLSKRKIVVLEDKAYTIPRILTYHYEENKKMCFEVFINNENSLIEFVEESQYFLVNEKSSYPLNEVEVFKKKDCSLNGEVFFKYKIICNLLNHSNEDMIFKDCSLRIKNESFTLECFIGYLAIYRGEYPEVKFKDLYGNYAYLNNELHMVGITIELDSSYKELKNISIGDAYSQLKYIEKDRLYDSELLESTLKHPIIHPWFEQESFFLRAKQNYYYMPVSYPNLALFTDGCILLELDGKTCYIEDFTYLANDISLINYSHTKREGRMIYA